MINKFNKFIEKIQMGIGFTCFSIFLLTVLCQVISRILRVPMIWTEDVANYSFIWSVLMGASILFNRNLHFKFNLMDMKLKDAAYCIYDISVNAIILFFTCSVTIYGIEAVKQFWNYKWNSIPQFKMGYYWMCIPIMGITMTLYAICHILDDIRRIKEKDYVTFDLIESATELDGLDIEKEDKEDTK